jgi:hypothetical protein
VFVTVRAFRAQLIYALNQSAAQVDCSNVESIGSFRRRLPVAAKIAFVIAGMTAEVPGSPIPPGEFVLWTMCTSTVGASSIRSIW